MSVFLTVVLILVGILLLWNLVSARALIKAVMIQNNLLRSLLFAPQEPTAPDVSE